MMDIALFPQLKKEFKIMSVPAVIKNNDKLLFGSKTIDEILDFIERIKRTASRISVKLLYLSFKNVSLHTVYTISVIAKPINHPPIISVI